MSSNQMFTAETARKIADSRKNLMKKDNEELASKIVEYVNSVLAGEVQKAIDDNVYCSSTTIMLPKPYRKALLKLSDNELSLMKNSLYKQLSKNGFEIKLQQNSWSCDECLWKYLACTKYYNIYVSWH